MDHAPPGSSVHGILQARILEWVAISFSNVILHLITKSNSSVNRILQFAMACYCTVTQVMSDSVTPWTEAHQASWSSTTSWSLLKLMCTVDDAMQPCHPLLSPSPPGLNLSQHQFFPVSQLFASSGQSIGLSASTLVLPMNIQG